MFCEAWPDLRFFLFTSKVPALLYYSHIPTVLITLLIGFFVYFKNRNSLSSKILFAISIAFFLWVSIDLILWVNPDSRILMFLWSSLGIISSSIYFLCLYFVYVFIDQKDISFRIKLILGTLLLPVVVLTPTNFNLDIFNITDCGANGLEGIYFTSYYFLLGFIVFIWVAVLSIQRYRIANPELKKEIIALVLGIELFLLSFFSTGFLASYLVWTDATKDFATTQYGLFGMTFFMGMLAFMIVKFKAFNIKLIGTQALVVAQFVLIGSMFFFAQSLVNQILVGVTLIGTTIMGGYVIRSVKVEIERKEELQKISDALAIANARLKELDLTKSEFISIASHQLRTPLTAIKGYISLLLEGSYGEISATVQDILDKVYSVNSRLVHLVEDLLNVSRIEAGRIQYSFAPTQLEPLVAELVGMFTPMARSKKLSLQMRLPQKPLPQLTIDPNKIKEVLSNLIDNALKYTKEGSVTVSLEGTGSVARIMVTDTGIGILPEDKKNLFEKFTRSKETTKMVASGAGLGLYVGKNFVEAHGGKIWAESDGAGKGSRFIVELPLINPNIHIGTSDQPSPSEKK